jgi:hypothetical protein
MLTKHFAPQMNQGYQATTNPTKEYTVRTIRNFFTPLLATGAVAAAIAAAPTAAAASVPTCVNVGASATQCQTPGNVQINDSPPIQIQPQYPYLGLGLPHHHGGHRH